MGSSIKIIQIGHWHGCDTKLDNGGKPAIDNHHAGYLVDSQTSGHYEPTTGMWAEDDQGLTLGGAESPSGSKTVTPGEPATTLWRTTGHYTTHTQENPMAGHVALTIQSITKSGLEPTYASADAAGNRFRNTGKEFIHVVNGGGGPVVVTMVTPAQVAGLEIEDKTVSVGAGTDQMIGPFEPGYYNQPAGGTDAGESYVEYDQVTSVTVAVIRP